MVCYLAGTQVKAQTSDGMRFKPVDAVVALQSTNMTYRQMHI